MPNIFSTFALMKQHKKKSVGRPKIKETDKKHKRAVSLTDSEFDKAKKYYGSPSKAILFAIDLKEKLQ